MLFIASFLLAFVLSLGAVSTSDAGRVIKEYMQPRDGIEMTSAADEFHELTVQFAITELNREMLEIETRERTSPGSAKYGVWMSKEEVDSLLVNEGGTKVVREWLAPYAITYSKERPNYFDATASVKLWEQLLGAKFFWYEGDGYRICRAKEYSLPDDISDHVIGVRGVVDLPPKHPKSGPLRAKNDISTRHHIVINGRKQHTDL